MNTEYRLGIIGCGDFLRLQADGIRRSKGLSVSSLYDPDTGRSKHFAAEFQGARVAASAEQLIDTDDVDIVGIFVPPWLRKPLMLRAARAGKPVLTTKPLAPAIEDCEEIIQAFNHAGVTCGVIYSRSEDAKVETLKQILDSGRFGKLALYKQDWIHHYPKWNSWALDPVKNGGPFMDAMIHNLNTARYLMGRPALQATMFSERHAHPGLSCADTEFLKIDFAENASAYLFITWAADLAVHSIAGNHREHVDIWYAITDKGWRITTETRIHEPLLVFSRDGHEETVAITPITETPCERLIRAIQAKEPPQGILASLPEAAEDIRIIRRTGTQPGLQTQL